MTPVNEKECKKLLNEILDWALSNRGTKHEFVTCYTYGRNPITGETNYPKWVAKARKFLNEETPDTRYKVKT